MPSLGRPLSGGVANATINLVTPGDDVRRALEPARHAAQQGLPVRRPRLFRANLDIYNILNGNPVRSRQRRLRVLADADGDPGSTPLQDQRAVRLLRGGSVVRMNRYVLGSVAALWDRDGCCRRHSGASAGRRGEDCLACCTSRRCQAVLLRLSQSTCEGGWPCYSRPSTLSRPAAHAEVLEKVVLKVRGGLMPPAGSPRPSEDARTRWFPISKHRSTRPPPRRRTRAARRCTASIAPSTPTRFAICWRSISIPPSSAA